MKLTYFLFLLFASLLFNSCDNDESASPVIGIISPNENETFFVGSNITIQINANDPDGIIERIVIEVNDQQINEFDFEPYSYVWSTDGYPEGIQNIKATAFDNDGLSSSTSIQITLDVENPQIATLPISFIGTTYIQSGIEIESNGNPSIVQSGLCWNQTGNPTIDDNLVGASIEGNPIIISGLEVDTEYHVRAFADNGISITYGETMTATTLSTYISDTGSIVDSRDGNTYNWVQIGNQKWFAQNLMYEGEGPNFNYIETPYGFIYRGEGAICPNGWHIPTEDEWNELIDFVGGPEIAGGVLKESGIENWESPNTGANNTAGFSALPTGFALRGPAEEWEFVELQNEYKSTAFIMSDAVRRLGLTWNSESTNLPYYGNGEYLAACRCIED
ncbi:FISUMP domain-containing protein [Hanstruepera ponticola]|uniref:FISUMP domain-containing protein n=1 Tax=Hanstruepera ponticola TaxID=2042995 RepID=UPI000CF13C63|nr:FISUMP domain-containing protein [Hanstruepera ponticola]